MTTTAKIAARILRHVQTTGSISDGVTAAAWEALVEVRELGWTISNQCALLEEFAQTGAAIAAYAAQAA